MRVKGAVHIHSALSGDGTMTIAEIAQFYRQRNYHFIALTDHAEDLDADAVEILKRDSRDNSDSHFCIIPGLEFSAHAQLHILGLGVTELLPQDNRLAVIDQIHSRGGLAILAHPRRLGWNCPAGILRAIDGVEIWNVGYDGKFLPSARALGGFAEMRQVNPRLLAVAGHDFHRRESFYDVGLEMDVAKLSAEAILEILRGGHYRIRSRFFQTVPDARISPAKAAYLRMIGGQLRNLRRARSFGLGWFS
ncbi:MAG TPA: hypothetical protein VNJ52_11210 [Patescibacteria group bacterium]|nr:hypothetical protein [Patescibacteria group bacterium]